MKQLVKICVVAFTAFAFMGGVWSEPASAAKLGKTLDEIKTLAKTEGPARIAITWRKKLRKALTKAFKKKYDLKVKATRVRGLASRERILNESIAGVVAHDLVNVSGELRTQYIKAGVVIAVPWGKFFPGLKKAVISPDNYFVASGFSKYGIVYNTKLVPKDRIPKGWADCLDPYWKGNFAVLTRPRTFTGLWPGWGKDKSIAYHKKLKANKPMWSSGQTATVTKIGAGEVAMGCGLGLHGLINVKRRDPTAPIEFVVTPDLPIQIGEALALMKGSKNPNAAVLLAGFLASKDGQKFYHIQGRSSPFIKGSVSAKLIKDAGAKLVWGGWEFAGARETEAAGEIVAAWGFPKAKRSKRRKRKRKKK